MGNQTMQLYGKFGDFSNVMTPVIRVSEELPSYMREM